MQSMTMQPRTTRSGNARRHPLRLSMPLAGLLVVAFALPTMTREALARPVEPLAPVAPATPAVTNAPSPTDQPPVPDTPAPKKQNTRKRRAGQNAQRHAEPIDRALPLNAEKADALFELLAPDRVKVLVFRTPNGVKVRGSAREVRVLAAMAKILTREEAAHRKDPDGFLDRARASADTTATVDVPDPASFFRLLAIDDVPVIVRKVPEGIEVRGSKQDIQVIRQVASIARGKPLKQQDKRARASKKAPTPGPKKDRSLIEMVQTSQRELGEQLDVLREQFAHRGEEFAQRAAEFREEMHELRERMEIEAEHFRRELAETREILRHELETMGVPQEWVDRIPGDRDEIVTREYHLPPQHADSLFRLFAPNDIRDVLVTRVSPETVRIRARARDHQTIEALVDLLARNAHVDRGDRQF